jgi:signal transduction histidine kinase
MVEIQADRAVANRTNQQALRLALRLGDLRLISDRWRAVGDTYDPNESTQGQHCYEQALATARQAHWAVGMGHAYMGLGMKATDIDDNQRALLLYQQAAQQFETMPATAANQADRARYRLLVLANQISVYCQLNDDATAARLCRQALAVRAQALATAPNEAWRQQFVQRISNVTCNVLWMQSNVYEKAHQLDSARRCAEQGLRLATHTENQADFRLNLAGIALAQHQPVVAHQQLRLGLQLARQSGYSGPLEDGLKLLPQVLHALHRPEAYDSLQAYVTLMDTVNAQARLEAIAQAQARFDNREQQARIRALEQDRRLARQGQELTRLRTRQERLGLGALGALLLAGGGALFARYRRRQAAARTAAATKLRQRLAADLHDDVGNLLTQISMQSSLLREVPGSPEQLLARLDQLTTTARQATQQMSDVVWGLNQTQQTLPELLERMSDHAHEVLYPLGIEVDFEAAPAVATATLAPEILQSLYLIYKEALHNVVKHARATRVTVRLDYAAPAGLRLEVRDNGQGPAGAPRPDGNGLRNMQARAQAIGGSVQYEQPAPGFAVVATLPALAA